MADTIAGIAAATYGHMVTTIDTNFNYLEAIRDTTEVVCEAKVVRHGGRITVLTVEVFDDKGTLVCNGGFTYYNIVNQNSTMYGFEKRVKGRQIRTIRRSPARALIKSLQCKLLLTHQIHLFTDQNYCSQKCCRIRNRCREQDSIHSKKHRKN